MHDQARINSELIEENALSKQKIQDLEQSELVRKQAEEALRDSKEQYQFVVENLKEVVFRTDAEGHWTFLNSAWAEVTGFAVEESLGMAFLEYVYPEDRQLNLELFRPLIERKKDYCRHEIRYMNKNGEFRWIEVWARLTLDEKGNATGTAGTLTDITERKQAEEALRDSKEQYQFVVENLKEVVFRTDAEGHWTFLNSAWAEVTGFAVEESLGMAFWEYVYPEDRQLNLELFRPLIERKKDYCRHEIRYMNKNGEFRWIEVWARLTLDEKGNATGTAGTLTDITERKRVEEEREKLIHELSDAMSKIKTLSGMLPICASCKRIRDDKGYWNQIESYIKSHSEAEFTHSVCPECAKKLYPEYYKKMYPD
jgi:PAS domain S-box-containing protein